MAPQPLPKAIWDFVLTSEQRVLEHCAILLNKPDLPAAERQRLAALSKRVAGDLQTLHRRDFHVHADRT